MGSRPESRRAALLYELCVEHGYYNNLGVNALAHSHGADEVVDAVLLAGGLDPTMSDQATQAPLTKAVDDWLFDLQGRGVRSGLPR
jgi:hypothetical protein